MIEREKLKNWQKCIETTKMKFIESIIFAIISVKGQKSHRKKMLDMLVYVHIKSLIMTQDE